MGTEIQAVDVSNLPAELQELFDISHGDDLSSGVSGGFSVVSIRGSKFRIKHSGEEEPVVDDNGEPIASLELVIVKAKPEVSKIFYEADYEEGDSSEPDCFSVDGIAPDPNASNKQSIGCAACPHNQWGSRITPAGKKAKRCSDNRRIAVVPLNDLKNDVYGGAMLLRVPAASLSDLSMYGKKMVAKGYPYNAIATRIGFDINASYPKLTFKAMRPLTSDELTIVGEHITGDVVTSILSESIEIAPKPGDKAEEQTGVPAKQDMDDFEDEAPPAAAEAVDDTFEDAETAPAPAPASRVAKKKTKKKAAKKADPEPSKSEEVTGDAELDDILKELDDLG